MSAEIFITFGSKAIEHGRKLGKQFFFGITRKRLYPKMLVAVAFCYKASRDANYFSEFSINPGSLIDIRSRFVSISKKR